MVKRFLTNKNIKYREVNLEYNPAAAVMVFQATGKKGVPQTKIGDNWVIGYDPKRIDKFLKTL